MRRLSSSIALVAGIAMFSSATAASEKARGRLPAWALEAWNKADGPAAASVFRYAETVVIPCRRRDIEKKCSLAGLAEFVKIFHSRPYEAPSYALAAIYYNPDTGNALVLDASIFRKASSGAYVRLRGVDGLIGPVDSATLNDDVFSVTTSTLMPDDPHCCPSGRTVWRVPIKDGKATYESGYKDPGWKIR